MWKTKVSEASSTQPPVAVQPFQKDGKPSKFTALSAAGGAVAVFVVLRKLVQQRRRNTHRQKNTQCHGFAKLIEPGSEYKPLNPKWLVMAAKWAEEGLPADIEFERCPLVEQFLAECGEGWTCGRGLAARHKLFILKDDVVYLNHGSYGASFRLCLESQSWYRNLLEEQPVKFMETTGIRALISAKAAVAAFVGAAAGDVVALPNATTAINTVVKSCKLQAGDALLMTSLTYPAVRSTLASVAAAVGAKMVEVQLPSSVLNDQQLIIKCFKQALELGEGSIRLAVIDHIASFPPVHFPVQDIVELCHKFGAQVMIDGSHAIGSMPLDVPSYGAEYYTSNLHKWLCTPKGTAFLWVNKTQQRHVKPLVVSHGYSLGFQGEFLWQGTGDYTPWLAVPGALAVWHALSPETVWKENNALLKAAMQEIESAFGPRQVFGLDSDYSCMAAFDLPPILGQPPTPEAATQLHDTLRQQFNTEIPVVYWMHKLWVRFSAQMYNHIDEHQSFILALASIGARLHPSAGLGNLQMTPSASQTSLHEPEASAVAQVEEDGTGVEVVEQVVVQPVVEGDSPAVVAATDPTDVVEDGNGAGDEIVAKVVGECVVPVDEQQASESESGMEVGTAVVETVSLKGGEENGNGVGDDIVANVIEEGSVLASELNGGESETLAEVDAAVVETVSLEGGEENGNGVGGDIVADVIEVTLAEVEAAVVEIVGIEGVVEGGSVVQGGGEGNVAASGQNGKEIEAPEEVEAAVGKAVNKTGGVEDGSGGKVTDQEDAPAGEQQGIGSGSGSPGVVEAAVVEAAGQTGVKDGSAAQVTKEINGQNGSGSDLPANVKAAGQAGGSAGDSGAAAGSGVAKVQADKKAATSSAAATQPAAGQTNGSSGNKKKKKKKGGKK